MKESVTHRVLVVGAGSIGHRHTRCFLQIPGVAAAICEPSDKVRNDVAGRYSLLAAYSDYQAVPLDQFDVVVICTPAPMHLPMSIRALDAGCHVLCEKPLSTTLNDVDAVAQAARRNARVFRVAYTWRNHLAAKWIKQYLTDNPAVSVLSAVINTGQDFPFFRPAYRDTYYTRHETGGGAVQDASTHMIDLLQWFLGPARSVHCMVDHLALDGVEVEDAISLTMRFHRCPAIATLTLNQFQKNNDLRIDLAARDVTLRYDMADARAGICTNTEAGWSWHPIPARERDDNYIDQARAFLDAVEGKPSHLATLDEAAHALRVALGALESARTGRRVDLPLPA